VKAVHKATKELAARPAELQAWLRRFYADHQSLWRTAMEPAVTTYAEDLADELSDELGIDVEVDDAFIADYVDNLAFRHADSSLGQLLAVLEDEREASAEDLQTALDEELAHWADIARPAHIGHMEAIRAGGAFVKAVAVVAGFTALRWVTVGKTCPLCTLMEGRTARLSGAFLDKGETLTPEEGTALTTYTKIGHPPLHPSCDCLVVPVRT